MGVQEEPQGGQGSPRGALNKGRNTKNGKIRKEKEQRERKKELKQGDHLIPRCKGIAT
jgi:hypothetical protein